MAAESARMESRMTRGRAYRDMLLRFAFAYQWLTLTRLRLKIRIIRSLAFGVPMPALDVAAIRSQFPALSRMFDGRPAVYFDGPAGSQVPQQVVDAIGKYMLLYNGNHGGAFATSRENDPLLHLSQ